MGKSRVDPRKYGMSRGQVKGSWWFVLHCPDGSTSMCHYSPILSIGEVIRKSGGDPDLHVAKYGSKVLENNKCLEDYRVNLNGAVSLGDTNWDGKLGVVTVSSKGVLTSIRSKFSKKSGSSSAGGSTYDLVLLGASGLIAADKSGTSDPYVVFSFEEGGKVKSSTKKKSLSAVWGSDDLGEPLTLQGPPKEKAVLKVQVFDANVIQKDVLLGEVDVNMDTLYKEIHYNTFSIRTVMVPLAPQGWVTFGWKTADQKYSYKEPLILEPSTHGFSSMEVHNEYSDAWHSDKTPVVTYHSNLQGVIRFLESRLYEPKLAENSGSLLKVAVQFDETDSWKELAARWTPELLQHVAIFALEVKVGHTPGEVSALLEAVKAAPSIGEVHLLDFDSSDAMEHGIQALKGAPHVTKLKYSDDQGEVNDDGVTSLTELVGALPALASLELVPSAGMLKSAHVPKLLETVAGLKLRSLTFTDLPEEAVDLSALIKTTAAESLAIKFRYAFSFDKEGLVWKSTVENLKECPVRKFYLEHRCLVAEPVQQLVQAVLEMPQLEEFRTMVKGAGLAATLPLLASPTLKGLSIKVDGSVDADDFVAAATANKVLERLELEGDLTFYQAKLAQLARENATLKVLYLDASSSTSLSYCDSALLKDFAANTSLERAVLSIYKIYDSDFRKSIEEVTETWKQRGAFFDRHHE